MQINIIIISCQTLGKFLTFPSLCFIICKMGMKVLPTALGGFKEPCHVKSACMVPSWVLEHCPLAS